MWGPVTAKNGFFTERERISSAARTPLLKVYFEYIKILAYQIKKYAWFLPMHTFCARTNLPINM